MISLSSASTLGWAAKHLTRPAGTIRRGNSVRQSEMRFYHRVVTFKVHHLPVRSMSADCFNVLAESKPIVAICGPLSSP